MERKYTLLRSFFLTPFPHPSSIYFFHFSLFFSFCPLYFRFLLHRVIFYCEKWVAEIANIRVLRVRAMLDSNPCSVRGTASAHRHVLPSKFWPTPVTSCSRATWHVFLSTHLYADLTNCPLISTGTTTFRHFYMVSLFCVLEMSLHYSLMFLSIWNSMSIDA